MIDDPLGLSVEATRGMQSNLLVVLDRQVVPGRIQVCCQQFNKKRMSGVTDLHEETGDEGLSDVGVVIARGEVAGDEGKIVADHDSGELLADIVGRLHAPLVDEVLVGPLGILGILFPRVVSVEHRKVVSIDMHKVGLGLVCGSLQQPTSFGAQVGLLMCSLTHLSLLGTNEDVWDAEERCDRQNLVRTLELGAVHQHLGQLRVQR